jgi:alpha-1,3-fucosyltransferase
MIVSKVILKKSSNLSAVKSALKIILMWNAWSTKMEDKPLMKGQCQVRSCLFTTDMSLLEKSDIVVFHFDTLEDYPLNRKSHQRFVFFHFESPDNTALTLMDDPRIRYNYFNWTMTYRRDSDIFLRDFYGSLIAKTKTNNNTRASRYNYDKFKNHKPTFIEQNYVDALIRRKTKMVTWFVGHCQTPIRREEYVRQLSQYVSVDVFGSCTKKCPYHCDEMLRADYKFYLAFENSWCPDYVTEKFIRPYVYDAVPIVLGGANYSNFAPSYSYINVKDFKSPKELADYLILLDKSDKLYAQYFNWKREYDVSTLDMHGWCELCRMANDNSMPTKVYHDIKKWWLFEAGECKTNSSNYF